MFCEKCGTKIDDGQLFCPNCGNRLSDPAAPEAPAEPVPPVAPAAPVATPETAAPNTEPIPGTLPNYAAAPAYQPKAPFKGLKLPSCGGLFDKVNEKEGLGQIYYLCAGVLLLLCFILSIVRVFTLSISGNDFGSGGFSSISEMLKGLTPQTIGAVSSFVCALFTVLFTLSITAYVLDFLGKATIKKMWFFIAGAMALILIVFIILWIKVCGSADFSGISFRIRLSVGGWFFLILQLALTAASVLLVVEDLKKN